MSASPGRSTRYGGSRTALLGTVDIIPAPDQLAAEFSKLIQNAMSRGVAQADLRVWAPQGAEVLFVRQVAPTVEDLTSRRTAVNAADRLVPDRLVG